MEIWEIMARFEDEIDIKTREYLKVEGFGDGRVRAVGCMGWIWAQWLTSGNGEMLHGKVGRFVERGMEMQRISSKMRWRPLHDLYLLHCGIFASSETQLRKLADTVVDCGGYKEYRPINDGELLASAWCGMLKYRILQDEAGVIKNFKVILEAHRPPFFRVVSKLFIEPWIDKKWQVFIQRQNSEFKTYWKRAESDRAVLTSGGTPGIVNFGHFAAIEQLSWWSHCGLALLAFRSGVRIATDELWLPAHALEIIERNCIKG